MSNRRLVIAIALSFVFHIAVVLGLSGLAIISDVRSPVATLQWIDIDNELGMNDAELNANSAASDNTLAQTPGVPDSAQEKQPDDEKPSEQKKQKKPDKAKGPTAAELKAKKLAALSDSIEASTKSQASLAIFVNAKNVAKSPYAAEAKRFLKVFYDYKTLLQGSSIDPIRDLDYILIATPNPFRVTKTLLAIWLGIPQSQLKNAITTRMSRLGQTVNWSRKGAKIPSPPFLQSDKRQLLLQRSFLLLGERKYISTISSLRKLEGQHNEIRDMKFGKKSWVNTMLDLNVFKKKFSTLGISVHAHQLKNMVRLPPGTLYPESISARVDVGNPVPVNAQATFKTHQAATRFHKAIKGRLSKYSIILFTLGFGPLVKKIQFKVNGQNVDISASYTEAEAKKLLGLLSDVMPKVDLPSNGKKTGTKKPAKPAPTPILVTPKGASPRHKPANVQTRRVSF